MQKPNAPRHATLAPMQMRRKAKAPGFLPTPSCGSALISRILYRGTLRHCAVVIYLSSWSDQPAPASRRWCDYYPELSIPCGICGQGGPFLLFCLAPHEVCRASFLAVGAVGSYPAFSPLPVLSRRRFVFCDTVCDCGLHRSPHAFTWHAALGCPDFPPARHLAVKRERSLRPTRGEPTGA